MNITFIDTEITVKCSEFVVQFNLEGRHINAKGNYKFGCDDDEPFYPEIETVKFTDEDDNIVLFGITEESEINQHISVELNEKHGDSMLEEWNDRDYWYSYASNDYL